MFKYRNEIITNRTFIIIVITYNNLAYTDYHKGHYEEALDYSLNVIELSSRALGDVHPNTHTFQNTLQTIHQKLLSSSEQAHSIENKNMELF